MYPLIFYKIQRYLQQFRNNQEKKMPELKKKSCLDNQGNSNSLNNKHRRLRLGINDSGNRMILKRGET